LVLRGRRDLAFLRARCASACDRRWSALSRWPPTFRAAGPWPYDCAGKELGATASRDTVRGTVRCIAVGTSMPSALAVLRFSGCPFTLTECAKNIQKRYFRIASNANIRHRCVGTRVGNPSLVYVGSSGGDHATQPGQGRAMPRWLQYPIKIVIGFNGELVNSIDQ